MKEYTGNLMRANKTELFLINILLLLANAMFIANILVLPAVVSNAFVVLFCVLLCLVLSVWTRKMNAVDVIVLLILLISALIILCSTLLYAKNVTVNINYFKKYLLFVSSVLYLSVANELLVDDRCVKILIMQIRLVSVFIVIVYFVWGDQLYLYNTLGEDFLYFNFYNPNFAALNFFVFCVANLSFFSREPKVVWRILSIALGAFMAFLCYETRCRNAIFMLLIFGICWIVVTQKRNDNIRMRKGISWIIASWPLIFCILYLVAYSQEGVFSLFSFIESGTKTLDTRVMVWSPAWQNIMENPIIGAYHIAVQRQQHNSHLDVWLSYGLVTMIVVIFLLYSIIYNKGRYHKTKRSILYTLSFCACVGLGMAEAALFSGSQSFFIFVGAFLLLRNYENGLEEEER